MISSALKVPVKFDDILWATGLILMACGNDRWVKWVGFALSIIGIIF